jgi:hypothetical protein
LDRAEVQARLHLPADQHLTQPESGICRALYDCPDQRLGKTGKLVRLIVATHPAGATKSRVGLMRAGVVYELFLTVSPRARSPLPMWCRSTCIAERLSRLWLMKTWSKTPIADVVIRLAVSRHGKSSANGSGTCVWSWAISLSQSQCAQPNLLLRRSSQPLPRPLHRAMDQP